MRLTSDRKDWEELGETDPEWAILSDPQMRGGGWDSEEFFATGPRDTAEVLRRFAELPSPRYGSALDFGCGLGRLTRALAGHFETATGVDISSPMIEGARRLNAEVPGARFVVNDRADLREVAEDESLDLVFSFIALQHVSSTEAIEGYLRDFVRVLRPGGMIAFQLPSHISPMRRIQPRRHAYRALRSVGVSPETLSNRLGLHPMAMRHLPVGRVREILTGAGATMIAAETDPPHPDFPGYLSTHYYATR